MKKMFELLDKNERRILSILLFILLGVFLFYIIVALGEKRAFLHSSQSLQSKKNELQIVRREKALLEEEWKKWSQAIRDYEELSEKYLYHQQKGLETLRKDLQIIFTDTEVQVSPLRYDYVESEEEGIKRIKVSFEATGTYFSLKKFIHTIEKYPRFLMAEKIDFLDINPQSGILKLKLVLAGYYE